MKTSVARLEKILKAYELSAAERARVMKHFWEFEFLMQTSKEALSTADYHDFLTRALELVTSEQAKSA
jgi:hypothetical protein